MSDLHKILSARRDPVSDSEYSDSVDSTDSDSLAHIPIVNFDITLGTMSLDESQTQTQANNILTQLMSQINILNENIQQIAAKQESYENSLHRLTNPENTCSQNSFTMPVLSTPVVGDVFRIPDPIKSIPSYDGNRKQLQSWIIVVENTLSIFKNLVSSQVYNIYVQSILNKISGNAKDALCLAGNPSDFNDVKKVLIEAFGDRQELATYKAQLWSNKQSDHIIIRITKKQKK